MAKAYMHLAPTCAARRGSHAERGVLYRLYCQVRWSNFFLMIIERRWLQKIGRFVVTCAFFVIVAYGWFWGGGLQKFKEAMVDIGGLSIKKVEIIGNKRLSNTDIVALLGLKGQTPILGFNLAQARVALQTLPWVEKVDVRKVYPDKLYISLKERTPYAIWQHGGAMDLVDQAGQVIAPYRVDEALSLPLIVGAGAEDKAANFIKNLALVPQMRDQIHAYIRMGDRRWDLLLNNGIRILLPEKAPISRLVQVLTAPETESLLEHDVQTIDLRFLDRVVVGLSDEALERQKAVAREQGQQLKMLKTG